MQIVPAKQQVRTAKASARKGVKPEGVGVHYTGGRGGNLLRRISVWAKDREWKSSTDFVVGRKPKDDPTVQMTTAGGLFSRYTWHCGGSVWHGEGSNRRRQLMLDAGFKRSHGRRFVDEVEKRANLFLIGVDADNYGYLDTYRGKGYYRRSRKQIDRGVRRSLFVGPTFEDAKGKLWEAYTNEQIEELCRIVYLIAEACDGFKAALPDCPPDDVTDTCPIVGHEDIRSTKQDPGPAFEQYWPEIYNAASGRYVSGLLCL